jgi:hypothetical protein
MKVAQLQNMIFDEDHRRMFLGAHGWNIDKPVGRDSSIRRYFRVSKNDQTAILMETVPDHSPHVTPGHSLGDFIRIAEWMNAIGLKVPEIYEQDLNNGYLLLEDLGDVCFRDALDAGENAQTLYTIAKDTLAHIAAQDCPLNLPAYYESHVHRRHRRVVDWFVPLARSRRNETGLIETYKNLWQEIETTLPPCPQSFLHIDFHAQNLMWLPKEQGIKRCGILDFQGAMIGPLLYDLANLLEDARRDVPANVKETLLAPLGETEKAWFRILATQFHCRVIGQFIKQAALDENPSYLKHIPRLQNYLYSAMKDPLLQPLKQFFDDLGIDFSAPADLNSIPALHVLVAPDAQ